MISSKSLVYSDEGLMLETSPIQQTSLDADIANGVKCIN